MIGFLQSLVLYQTDQLPCDIDGDGKIDEHFMVQGMDTGRRTLQPRVALQGAGQDRRARSATSAANESSPTP